MPTAPNTPRLFAYAVAGWIEVSSFHSGRDDDAEADRAAPPFATREDAEAFVALLPKSCKVRASTITGRDYQAGLVKFNAMLAADGVNGGRNETGIKRYRALAAACERIGCPIIWTMPFSNSITEAELAELIG